MPDDPYRQRPEALKRQIDDRQYLLRKEIEDTLRSVILDYEPRRAAHWHRDYSSLEAFEASVAEGPGRVRAGWHGPGSRAGALV